MERLLTVRQCAEILGIGQRSVGRLLADERLPVVRIGRSVRVAPSALKEFAARGGTGSRIVR